MQWQRQGLGLGLGLLWTSTQAVIPVRGDVRGAGGVF
jgi:hypothetical protein